MYEEVKVDVCTIQGTMNEFICIRVLPPGGALSRITAAALELSNSTRPVQQGNLHCNILYIWIEA